MEILVKRDIFNDDCTLGQLSIGDNFVCYTLEDAVREIDGEPVEKWKIAGQTAIPRGRYEVIITYSNRFSKYLCELIDVPGFIGIRIHSGNTNADTEGCILLGTARGTEAISNSRDAVALFQPMVGEAITNGEKCWITIE